MLKGINWNDLRIKGWQAGLILATAYSAYNPKYAWATPALTAIAGLSQSPAGKAAPANG